MQQWHPDKWTRTPSVLGEAKRKFQQIQEAYSGNQLIIQLFWIADFIVSSSPISLTILFCPCIYAVSEQFCQTRGKEQCTTQGCMILMKRKTRWVMSNWYCYLSISPLGSINILIMIHHFSKSQGFSDFLQEMLSLMANVKREVRICGNWSVLFSFLDSFCEFSQPWGVVSKLQGKTYSREELQSMLMEMVGDFECPQVFCGGSIIEDSRSIKRGRWETKSMVDRGSHIHV